MGKEVELAIVFADVVGSTKLYELLGDLRARDMVGICIEVMRGATEQNGGTVIKTMGDEVMATFPTADDALNAAAQMQKQITLHPSLKVQEQTVAIRIGCNFGPVVRENRDIFGSAVHTANRMTSQAKAGQIITTADHGRSPVERMARLRASDRHRHAQGTLERGGAVRGSVAARGHHQHGAGHRHDLPRALEQGQRLRLRYQGQEILVEDGRANISMGRAEENDLVIKGNLISRLHARVEFNRNKFMLIDQSTNGTFVISKEGEEAFVRRDSMQIRGEGLIGLGKAPDSNSSQVIRYICEGE